jgi:hypothetical protein
MFSKQHSKNIKKNHFQMPKAKKKSCGCACGGACKRKKKTVTANYLTNAGNLDPSPAVLMRSHPTDYKKKERINPYSLNRSLKR